MIVWTISKLCNCSKKLQSASKKKLFSIIIVYINLLHFSGQKELDSVIDFTKMHVDQSIINQTSSENLVSHGSNATSKYCNYFDTSEKWKTFLIINFVFLYLLPILIISITYGLIVKKVCTYL